MTTALAVPLQPRSEMLAEELYPVSKLGEGLTLRSRRSVEFTPDYAANTFLEFAEFWVGDEKVDRKLSEPHVIHLAREMLAGNFRWEQVNLVVCEVDGREYRLNGQHTAWARIYADEQGLDKRTRCPVQLLKYNAASIQDARQLYASLDRGKPRNNATVVNSHLLGTDEFAGYKAGQLGLLASGLGVWKWEKETKRGLHGPDDRAYLLMKDHYKVALHVGALIRESRAVDFKHLKKAPVVGAMFETFSVAPQIALEFWRSVRDGVGIGDKEDPRLVLRNYLMSTSLSKLFSHDMKVINQEECYRACVLMWNAHRATRRVRHIRVSMTDDRPRAR